MSIVNSILNLVDLNTTKYTKKLKQMRQDTKQAAKGIGQSFASLGSAWKAAIAGIAAGALTGAITKELQATEKSVAAFITATGSLAEARAQFEMLQQAARDTIQPFDALQAVALDLRKNGIQATAEQLKTFSQIAYGTGQSLETVGKAFTATMQGRYKALQQLGIQAKDNGATLQLTYKGITTEIEKNSAALSEYFAKIGKENEGVLEYLQSGVTGALNQLENAWGDFYRAIAESGLGDAIAHTIRAMGTALDSITAWINANQEPIRQFFNRWSDYIDRLSKNFVELTNDLNNFFKASQKVNGSGGKTEPGILGYLNAFAETLGEQIHDLVHGKEPERLFKAERDREMQLFKQRVANLKKGSAEYEQAVWETNERQKAIAKKYENETTSIAGRIGDLIFGGKEDHTFDRKLEEYSEYLDKQNEAREEARKKAEGRAGGADVSLTPFGTGGGSGGGGKASGRAAADTWAEYFARVQRIQRNGYSSVEKLRAEHQDALRELQEEYAKSSIATETEYQQARATLEQEYQRNIKEQRRGAADFLRSVAGDEEAQLAEDYRQKLEKLEQYHTDALVSEAEYLQALQKLRDDYEKERAKTRATKNEFITKDDEENIKQFTDAMGDLSDAFQSLTTGMSESSAAYKALFAIQKGFAVASATANAIVAWTKALSTSATWYESLANYANAVALTANIIGQLKSLTMHDKGGRIPAGQLGIVGEYGPELIQGPVDVTSRKRTAELARQAAGGTAGAVTVNLYENAERAGQVEQQDNTDGERIINIFVSNIRRGGAAARAMENTYQLRRFGA